MEHTANQVFIRGSLDSLPQFSHDNHGKQFYRFFLHVQRLSGTEDLLPVIASLDLLNTLDLSGGEQIAVHGEIRSYNSRSDRVRRLHIFVFAGSLAAEDGPPENDVILTGTLCKPPIYRRTPLGREICDVMLAVPRAYGRSDYLPCILWGKTAQEAAERSVGDHICLRGRMQSRIYQKATETGVEQRTAYEISVLTVQEPSQEQV